MLLLCRLVITTLQFSVSWNHGFLLSLSFVQSKIFMLPFPNSSIVCSGFLPTPVVQTMLRFCQWLLLCFLDSFFPFYLNFFIFLCGNTQVSWVHLSTQFLWMPLLIPSNLSHDVIPSTSTFFQTRPDTDTALDFLNIKTSHLSWSLQTHSTKKLLSGIPHTILPVCSSPLHST